MFIIWLVLHRVPWQPFEMCIYILKVLQLGVVGGVVGDSSLLEVGVDVEEDVAGDSDKVEGVGRSEAGEEEEDEVRMHTVVSLLSACLLPMSTMY